MEKWLSISALGVAGLMALLFVLDMALGFPFGGGDFFLVDVFGLLASALVGYLGFSAMRDLR